MSKVVEELDKTDHNVSIKEAAKSIAKGAFMGAKGCTILLSSTHRVRWT